MRSARAPSDAKVPAAPCEPSTSAVARDSRSARASRVQTDAESRATLARGRAFEVEHHQREARLDQELRRAQRRLQSRRPRPEDVGEPHSGALQIAGIEGVGQVDPADEVALRRRERGHAIGERGRARRALAAQLDQPSLDAVRGARVGTEEDVRGKRLLRPGGLPFFCRAMGSRARRSLGWGTRSSDANPVRQSRFDQHLAQPIDAGFNDEGFRRARAHQRIFALFSPGSQGPFESPRIGAFQGRADGSQRSEHRADRVLEQAGRPEVGREQRRDGRADRAARARRARARRAARGRARDRRRLRRRDRPRCSSRSASGRRAPCSASTSPRRCSSCAREKARAQGRANVRFENADAQTHAFPPASVGPRVLALRRDVLRRPRRRVREPGARACDPAGASHSCVGSRSCRTRGCSDADGRALKHVPPAAPPPPNAPGPFAFADPARVRGILERAGFAKADRRAVTASELTARAQRRRGGRLRDRDGAGRRGAGAGARDRARGGRRRRSARCSRPASTPKGVALGCAAWIVTGNPLAWSAAASSAPARWRSLALASTACMAIDTQTNKGYTGPLVYSGTRYDAGRVRRTRSIEFNMGWMMFTADRLPVLVPAPTR